MTNSDKVENIEVNDNSTTDEILETHQSDNLANPLKNLWGM